MVKHENRETQTVTFLSTITNSKKIGKRCRKSTEEKKIQEKSETLTIIKHQEN